MSEIRPKFDVDEVERWFDQIQALLPPEEYRRVAPLIQQDRGIMAQVRAQQDAAGDLREEQNGAAE